MPRGYAETSLGQIHYVRAGSGPPLLLLPAAGRSSRMFAALQPRLADGFDTVAIDPPGFGASDDLPNGTTIERLADAFVELMDRLGVPRASVYGLHTGNKVGTAMAVRHPDRVARLMLAGQSHSLIPDQETRNAGIRHIIQSYVDFGAAAPPAAERAGRSGALLGAGRTGAHPILGGGILDHVLDEVQARGTPALYMANFGYDLEAGFRAIPVPTQVLEIATAAETRDVGLQGPAVIGLIPGASLVTLEVPDGDALTLESHPDQLAAAIRAFMLPP